jgi:deazaflavin-dependent oxidoreductase (nitroreductase family)
MALSDEQTARTASLRGYVQTVEEALEVYGPPIERAMRKMRDDHVERILRIGTTDGVTFQGLPTVLMTYKGVKTGKLRRTPVMRVEHEGHYLAVASKGGEPTNPQWYASLVANPSIELQDGTVTGAYRAREVFGDERAAWWRRAVDAYPDYAAYELRTDRRIPVFVLEPDDRGTQPHPVDARQFEVD